MARGIMWREGPGIHANSALRLAFAAVIVLGGCSSVPDYMNPAEWFKSTSDAVSGGKPEGPAQTAGAAKPVPGADKPFPKLGEASAADAAKAARPVAKGLVGDAAAPRYAEPVSRQGAPTSVLGAADNKPAPAVPVVTAAPAPAPIAKPAPAPAPIAAAAPRETPPASPPAAPKLTAPGARPAALPAATEVAAPSYAMPAADPFATVVVSGEGIVVGNDAPVAPRGFGGKAVAPGPLLIGGAGASAPLPGDGPAIDAGAVKVATIQFSDGEAAVDPQGKAVLRDVARIVKRQGGRKVIIVGHASSRTRDMDPVRHAMVNYEVSARRAEAVAQTLKGLGVTDGIIEVAARADRQPVFHEVMPSGEAGNRRTEVYVVY